jgi:hypothetical protein
MSLTTDEVWERLRQAQNAIVALEQERELYRSRWLSCVTPEEAQRLRDRLAEADAVIAYFQFDQGAIIDGGVFRSNINRWADEALERYRDRQQERQDNSQFGVGA